MGCTGEGGEKVKGAEGIRETMEEREQERLMTERPGKEKKCWKHTVSENKEHYAKVLFSGFPKNGHTAMHGGIH